MTIQDTSPTVDGETLFQRSPREGGYQFVVCPKFPGFSFMLRPAEDDTALNATFVSFIAAEVAALAPPSSTRPSVDDMEHGGDGKFHLATERTIIARSVLSVIKNPVGLETIDWEIADAVLALSGAREAAQKSAPVVSASHNSGERDPSVMLDCVGADTALTRNEAPVVWRWKPKGAQLWIYNPEAGWLADQDKSTIDVEPLYASPPQPDTAVSWQPIETAPKDGTPILCSWLAQIYAGQPPERKIDICSWAGAWIPYDRKLTHWMPLPAPPDAGDRK